MYMSTRQDGTCGGKLLQGERGGVGTSSRRFSGVEKFLGTDREEPRYKRTTKGLQENLVTRERDKVENNEQEGRSTLGNRS